MIKKVGFIEALFGLLLTPRSVAEQLFAEENPPYVYTFFLIFILTIFVPMTVQIVLLELLQYRLDFFLSTLLVVTLSLMIFVLYEAVFLRLIGVAVEVNQMIAAIAYSLTPLMIIIWIFYGLNIYFDGSLSVFTILLTDSGSLNPSLVGLIPYLILVAQIGLILTFYCCLREIGDLYTSSALMVSILSMLPSYIALLSGILVAELAFPDTIISIMPNLPGIQIVQQLYNAIRELAT